MKNCIKGCGTVTEDKHCKSAMCKWYVCKNCKVVFDPEHINRSIAWRVS